MKKTSTKYYKLLYMWLQDLQKQWQMVVIVKTKKNKNKQTKKLLLYM